jgi:hypothetical protein
MISAYQLLDGRLRMGAYMFPLPPPTELLPPNPDFVLLVDTGFAILTSPGKEYIDITTAPIEVVLEDPDAIIFYFIVNRIAALDTTVGFEWRKIGTLPNAKLRSEFPIVGTAVMAPNQLQLALPLVLDSRTDLGQGYTLGVTISDPIAATIDIATLERTI